MTDVDTSKVDELLEQHHDEAVEIVIRLLQDLVVRIEKVELRLGENGTPRLQVSETVVYDAVCSACSKPTKLKFKPNPNRPVYCLDCYKAMNPR